MNCKIDRSVTGEGLVVFTVVGRLTEEHAEMLRNVLEEEADAAIDLQHVRLVDREAVKLLALFEAKGSELRNCPLYIREWVTRERRETE
jgi:anti-anti-sigma regulatory factor